MTNFRKRKFLKLNADSEVKAKVTGVKILTCIERSCPKACVCQMLKVYLNWYGSYEQFSEPKRRFWNLNADSKVNVTGVNKLQAWKGLVPRHVCAKKSRRTSFGMGVMNNYQNINTDLET